MFRRLRAYLPPVLYLCMSWQFLRYYVSVPRFLMHISEYLNGTERLPFQYRVLPILFLRPVRNLAIVQRIAASRAGSIHNPDVFTFFLLSAVALGLIYFITMKLYRAVSETRRLEFLVYPILIFILLWTYCIHVELDFSYPYDLLALFFFTAGIYFVYERRFWPLAAVVLVGTFNRETTLFLIGVYAIDAATVEEGEGVDGRFRFGRVPWLRAAALFGIWLVIKAGLAYVFRANDPSEFKTRFLVNLASIVTPTSWPVALNVGGYVLPVVLLFCSRIPSRRFANYLYILIPWLVVMIGTGMILETRVYGELSCYIAICAVLLLERYVEAGGSTRRFSAEERSVPERQLASR